MKKLLDNVSDAVADVARVVASLHCMRPPFGCGKPVDTTSFRDDESRREYEISAMCQQCQDAAFNETDI